MNTLDVSTGFLWPTQRPLSIKISPITARRWAAGNQTKEAVGRERQIVKVMACPANRTASFRCVACRLDSVPTIASLLKHKKPERQIALKLDERNTS